MTSQIMPRTKWILSDYVDPVGAPPKPQRDPAMRDVSPTVEQRWGDQANVQPALGQPRHCTRSTDLGIDMHAKSGCHLYQFYGMV